MLSSDLEWNTVKHISTENFENFGGNFRKTTKNFSQSPGRHSNSETSEHEAQMPTIRSRFSVTQRMNVQSQNDEIGMTSCIPSNNVDFTQISSETVKGRHSLRRAAVDETTK